MGGTREDLVCIGVSDLGTKPAPRAGGQYSVRSVLRLHRRFKRSDLVDLDPHDVAGL
jgi:hypothetical protein